MTIKDLINERLEMGVSIQRLSNQCKISRPTLYKIKSGQQVDLQTTKRVCEFFKVDWKDFVE